VGAENPGGTVRLVSDSGTAVAADLAGTAASDDAGRGASRAAVTVDGVWKTFRLPFDRPSTLKQRILHPRQSRAATQLHALRDVTFQVEEGEFFGIIGRNGSGKSTMLKCLAGIYRPDPGAISVAGRVSPFIELGVGFNAELTSRDNVVVNAALLGMSRSQALARFPDIIRFAELERFLDLKLKNYSSGMQVRLGFASAIQADAEVYLVDELLAVGDARFQEKCFDVFRSFKREGRTVVYVTHDLNSVERFCDRAVLLEGGEIAATGEPREVIHRYRELNLEQEQSEHLRRRARGPDRWGDGAAQTGDIWFEDGFGQRQTVLRQGDDVTLCVRIEFRESLEAPVFGVIVKNERGDHVFVTNTMFDRVETGTFAAGDEVVYKLRFSVIFADGTYTVSPAVAYEDAQRFADWWEDAISIAVRGERYTSGIVDLPHEVRVER
jgi:ABC-type polysaccharide/polyol phosphate transport system ATPase subunit